MYFFVCIFFPKNSKERNTQADCIRLLATMTRGCNSIPSLVTGLSRLRKFRYPYEGFQCVRCAHW